MLSALNSHPVLCTSYTRVEACQSRYSRYHPFATLTIQSRGIKKPIKLLYPCSDSLLKTFLENPLSKDLKNPPPHVQYTTVHTCAVPVAAPAAAPAAVHLRTYTVQYTTQGYGIDTHGITAWYVLSDSTPTKIQKYTCCVEESLMHHDNVLPYPCHINSIVRVAQPSCILIFPVLDQITSRGTFPTHSRAKRATLRMEPHNHIDTFWEAFLQFHLFARPQKTQKNAHIWTVQNYFPSPLISQKHPLPQWRLLVEDPCARVFPTNALQNPATNLALGSPFPLSL